MGVVSNIQPLRIARGWTQAELAALAGVSRQTINSVEANRFEPTLGLALRLSRLFDQPVDALFRLDDGA